MKSTVESMSKELVVAASSENKGQRLDVFLASLKIFVSRSQIQKLIHQRKILVDQKPTKVSYKIKGDEKIRIEIPPPEKTQIKPENIDIEIIYQDPDLLVINKYAGMVVHPAAGNYSGTLVNALLYHCRNLSGIGGILRPGIVHRLDKNTSGLLVVAKNDFAHQNLSEQLKQRSLKREYKALVWGHMPQKEGVISFPIGRSQKQRKKMAVKTTGSRTAVTEYEVENSFDFCELLNLKLQTGRTHQIRVHLQYLGHPVLGDPDYGGRNKNLLTLNRAQKLLSEKLLDSISRQALHSWKIGFVHPRTGKYLEFESHFPLDFQKALELLAGYEK